MKIVSLEEKRRSNKKDRFPTFKRLFKQIGEGMMSLRRRGWKYPLILKWFVGTLTSLLIVLVLSGGSDFFVPRYRVGDIASHNIKAPQDLLIEDRLSTEKRREEVKRELRSIYDFDPLLLMDKTKVWKEAFGKMAYLYRSQEKPSLKERGTLRVRFAEMIGVDLSDKEYMELEKAGFDPRLVDRMVSWLTPLFKRGIVANKELLLLEKEKGIVVRDLKTKEERVVSDLASFMDLKKAREELRNKIQREEGLRKGLRKVLLKIASSAIVPNLTFNKSATEERSREILASVRPVYFQIKKGEIIVREGERIGEEDLLKIQGLMKQRRKQRLPTFGIGIFLLSLLLFLSSYTFSTENIRKFRSQPKDLLLMGLILVGTMLMIKFGLFISEAFEESLPFLSARAYTYAIPVMAGTMLVRLFLNSETSIVFAAVSSLLSPFLLDKDLSYGLYFFIGSIVGAGALKHCMQRTTILKAGLLGGASNVVFITALWMIEGGYSLKEYLFSITFGLSGGLISALLVTGITPVIEYIFDYTTNIRLLELARLDHPLLKELSMRAPGTYHHSLIIGSLVEAAAEVVHANPLLARVSAYYHDIGKSKKPLYFVENQRGENRHERLTPTMSALILISHVKEGVELARQHKLGKEIIDVIKEHHGTSLITYFYNKAKEMEDPGLHEVDEKDFRYPGPKPQTKEAGLVMLADAVEAACKTIQDPTPAKIQGAVHNIINRFFADGQLDECELTLRDLHNIAKVFNRVLNGIYHSRVDYPEPVHPMRSGMEGNVREREEYEGIYPGQTEGGKDRQREGAKGGKRGLKRLGVSKR